MAYNTSILARHTLELHIDGGGMAPKLCDEEDVDLQFLEGLEEPTPEMLEEQDELFALLDRLQEVED